MTQSLIHGSRIRPTLCLAVLALVGIVIGLLSLPVPSLGADDARATAGSASCSEAEITALARKFVPYIHVPWGIVGDGVRLNPPYFELVVALGEPAIEPCLELLTSTNCQEARRMASVAIWAIIERRFAEAYDARFMRGQNLSEDDEFHAQASLQDQFEEFWGKMEPLDASGAPIEANIAKWKQWLKSSRPIPLERHSARYRRDGYPKAFVFHFDCDCQVPLSPSYASERKKKLESTIALLQQYKDSPKKFFEGVAERANEAEKKKDAQKGGESIPDKDARPR